MDLESELESLIITGFLGQSFIHKVIFKTNVTVSGGGGHYQSSRASDYGGDSSVKGGAGGGGTEMRI